MEVTNEELTAARKQTKLNALKDGESRNMIEMKSAAYGKVGKEENYAERVWGYQPGGACVCGQIEHPCTSWYSVSTPVHPPSHRE